MYRSRRSLIIAFALVLLALGADPVGAATRAGSAPAADKQRPSAPTGLTKKAATKTTISVAWKAAKDNVRVAGYNLYRGTTETGTTKTLAATFAGLACAKQYTFYVSARDVAGNRSTRAKLAARTAACGATLQTPADACRRRRRRRCLRRRRRLLRRHRRHRRRRRRRRRRHRRLRPPPPPADAQAPTVPGALQKTGSTETSVSVSWSASTDDVAVTGYGVYRDGSLSGSTGGTSYVVSGLACGMSYFISVDAYDAAGNRSAKVSTTATSSACPVSGGTANVYLSLSGSDSNACTQPAPCRSFDRGYRVASPGGVVEVAAGSYGDQGLLYDASKTSQTDVIFQPAPGASVTVGQLEFGPDRFTKGASHVTIKDITVTDDVQVVGCGTSSDSSPCAPETSSGGDDVTLQNLRVKGPYAFYCASCSHVSIIGGIWGPDTYQCRASFGSAHPEIQNAYNQQKRSHAILIDGATFQNFARCTGADHTECLQVEPADDMTVRNSVFMRCDTIVVNFANDLAFGSKSAAGYEAPNNILLENNFFDVSMDNTGGPTYYSVNIRECTNCTIRYNSWLQAPRMPNGQISLNNKYIGNVGPNSQANCDVGGITWGYNVWEGAKCAATDKNVANAGFVNRGAMNLHLAPGSPAINAGDPSFYPAKDIDGQARPSGGAPDAGAAEAH